MGKATESSFIILKQKPNQHLSLSEKKTVSDPKADDAVDQTLKLFMDE